MSLRTSPQAGVAIPIDFLARLKTQGIPTPLRPQARAKRNRRRRLLARRCEALARNDTFFDRKNPGTKVPGYFYRYFVGIAVPSDPSAKRHGVPCRLFDKLEFDYFDVSVFCKLSNSLFSISFIASKV